MHPSFRATLVAVALLIGLVILPLTPVRGSVTGQLVLDHGPKGSWDDRGVGRPSVIYSGSLFTMWYAGVGSDANTKNWYGIGRAISRDGITWTRDVHNPVLKPGSAGAWDSAGLPERGGGVVIFDEGKYKMWYDGFAKNGRSISIQIGYATSDDGIDWQKYPGNPILSPGAPGSFDDQMIFDPTVVHTGSSYVMYYAAMSQSGVSAAGIATSSDGVHWTKTGRVQLPAEQTWDSGVRALSSVTKLDDVFAMAYDGSQQSGQSTNIGLGMSRDGVSWAPHNANPVVSAGASWSSEGVYEGAVVAVGSNYHIYFNGVDQDGIHIGLAILPISEYNMPEFTSMTMALVVAMIVGFAGIRTRRFERKSPSTPS
jgi:beta-1,2-mannobiose phosphorylase / 1,2-beta-oligomannan phosphorylase